MTIHDDSFIHDPWKFIHDERLKFDVFMSCNRLHQQEKRGAISIYRIWDTEHFRRETLVVSILFHFSFAHFADLIFILVIFVGALICS